MEIVKTSSAASSVGVHQAFSCHSIDASAEVSLHDRLLRRTIFLDSFSTPQATQSQRRRLYAARWATIHQYFGPECHPATSLQWKTPINDNKEVINRLIHNCPFHAFVCPKMRFTASQKKQKPSTAGISSQTSMEELTTLPRPPSRLKSGPIP